MTEETKVRTSITVNPKVYEAAKASARALNHSFSSYVESCLQAAEKEPVAPEATEEATTPAVEV